MPTPFAQSSFRQQVRRLRLLARNALAHYPIKVERMHFIHYGENATFRVYDSRGRSYLVRVHQRGYHSPAGILEEMRWLKKLSAVKELTVPRPLLTKSGKLTVIESHPDVPDTRVCDVFHWIDGRFMKKEPTAEQIRELGRLTARLQKLAPAKTKHRKYWDAEGLVGSRAIWGGVDRLAFATPKERLKVVAARREVLKRLKAFQKRHPERLGIIHADLHFRNVLWSKGRLAAIDFDDCGLGFHAYDLAVPLSISKARDRLRPHLIAGYREIANWDEDDDRILDDLLIARSIVILSWFNQRLDNPRMAARARDILKSSLKEISAWQRAGR